MVCLAFQQYIIMMSRVRKSRSITHALTPFIQQNYKPLPDYAQLHSQQKNYTPLYKKQTYYNPHKERSRKHRLLEQKNTDIQRENRRLFQKLRKIKLKNAYQSQGKLSSMDVIPEAVNFGNTIKPLSLPQVGTSYNSLNTTKSQLASILTDRKTFVNKYFEDLAKLGSRAAKKTEELGNFICNGWKIKALLLDDSYVLLRGRKEGKQLTKKYTWEKVKNKINGGMQQWVKLKYQFQE